MRAYGIASLRPKHFDSGGPGERSSSPSAPSSTPDQPATPSAPQTPQVPNPLQSGQAASFQQATGVPGISSLYYQPQVSSPWAQYQQQLFPQNFVQQQPQSQVPNWAQMRAPQMFNNAPPTQYGGNPLANLTSGPTFQAGVAQPRPGQSMAGLPNPMNPSQPVGGQYPYPQMGQQGIPQYFPYQKGYQGV